MIKDARRNTRTDGRTDGQTHTHKHKQIAAHYGRDLMMDLCLTTQPRSIAQWGSWVAHYGKDGGSVDRMECCVKWHVIGGLMPSAIMEILEKVMEFQIPFSRPEFSEAFGKVMTFYFAVCRSNEMA